MNDFVPKVTRFLEENGPDDYPYYRHTLYNNIEDYLDTRMELQVGSVGTLYRTVSGLGKTVFVFAGEEFDTLYEVERAAWKKGVDIVAAYYEQTKHH